MRGRILFGQSKKALCTAAKIDVCDRGFDSSYPSGSVGLRSPLGGGYSSHVAEPQIWDIDVLANISVCRTDSGGS